MIKTYKITKFPVTHLFIKKILVIHFKRLVINNWSGNIVLLKKHILFPEQLKFNLKNNETKLY